MTNVAKTIQRCDDSCFWKPMTADCQDARSACSGLDLAKKMSWVMLAGATMKYSDLKCILHWAKNN